MSDRQVTAAGNTTRRNIMVQGFEVGASSQGMTNPMSLVVRYPQDFKRERVKFKLTALDLL